MGLGTLYRLGLGVQLDYRKAIQWYRRSASHGDSDAMNNLGYMFFNGLGVLPDVETALYWFGKSAAVDNPVAQYNIGVAYSLGRGVERICQFVRHGLRSRLCRGMPPHNIIWAECILGQGCR